LAQNISVVKNRKLQLVIGWMGSLSLLGFLFIHTYKDLTSDVEAWYFHSTPVWLIVMMLASMVFYYKWRQFRNQGDEALHKFKVLPEE
jgi:preprotein translocase subunit SecY